ncbi:hypothetical protein EST38_g8416 [Candolleomyces aberdarensis]|uniref:D-lactate dehydratase n=1 Tax=Candolleomyces aberdarensis TaxID=2316362 RepID=A0A4Q2DEW7_9AGAR|nr:hypothetical protein EST38_g8416 [Candolleomyces aberdarensis]
MPSVLFVFTSAPKTFTDAPAGWYLPEAAHPYWVLAPHATIDFASPEGPKPPVNEYSVQTYTDDDSVKFLNDTDVKRKLANAKKLSEVRVEDYDAIFYIGGLGPAIDLATDPVNAKLASEFWNSQKIVSGICHGPAGLVEAVDSDGKPILGGKRITSLSIREEEMIDVVKDVPFLLEDKIRSVGGIYEKADEPFGVKVVVDGQLITGQNPASGKAVGEAVLAALLGTN